MTFVYHEKSGSAEAGASGFECHNSIFGLISNVKIGL